MPYSPTTWTNLVTTVGPTNLNHLEGGLQTADANASTAITNAAAAQTTANAAIPKSVVTVAGDIVYATGSATVTRLAIGSAGQVLHGGASAPSWSALAISEIAGYPSDATKFARGDGTWAVVASDPVPATTLPGSPVNGQRAILTDSTTSPTYNWLFFYNGSSSNTDKWEFVGGTPLMANVATAESTSSTSYTDLATVGPTFTMTNAGIYSALYGAMAQVSSANQDAYASPKFGSATPSDTPAARRSNVQNTSEYNGLSAAGVIGPRITASQVIKLQYRSSAAISVVLAQRWMQVLPVRIS